MAVDSEFQPVGEQLSSASLSTHDQRAASAATTRLHFISGLPRSGSTLLAGILRQNPRFHAAMTSPVGALFSVMLNAMSRGNETALFVAWSALKEAYYGEHGRSLPILEYDILAQRQSRWSTIIQVAIHPPLTA